MAACGANAQVVATGCQEALLRPHDQRAGSWPPHNWAAHAAMPTPTFWLLSSGEIEFCFCRRASTWAEGGRQWGGGGANCIQARMHSAQMSAMIPRMQVPRPSWTAPPTLCPCSPAASAPRLQQTAQSPAQQQLRWQQNQLRRRPRDGRCSARRADSPILAPVIQLGEDGQVGPLVLSCAMIGTR